MGRAATTGLTVPFQVQSSAQASLAFFHARSTLASGNRGPDHTIQANCRKQEKLGKAVAPLCTAAALFRRLPAGRAGGWSMPRFLACNLNQSSCSMTQGPSPALKRDQTTSGRLECCVPFCLGRVQHIPHMCLQLDERARVLLQEQVLPLLPCALLTSTCSHHRLQFEYRRLERETAGCCRRSCRAICCRHALQQHTHLLAPVPVA